MWVRWVRLACRLFAVAERGALVLCVVVMCARVLIGLVMWRRACVSALVGALDATTCAYVRRSCGRGVLVRGNGYWLRVRAPGLRWPVDMVRFADPVFSRPSLVRVAGDVLLCSDLMVCACRSVFSRWLNSLKLFGVAPNFRVCWVPSVSAPVLASLVSLSRSCV